MASLESNSILETDPFDTLLTLEDTLYTTAYSAGVSDGARAGRVEGRVFGLEKGFEKFAALGELHGRSIVWGSRVLSTHSARSPCNKVDMEEEGQKNKQEHDRLQLGSLPHNSRLINNVTLLHSLTDPETFSTDNTEEGVADFDDRFKRAGAKAKVIERIVGEGEVAAAGSSKSRNGSPPTTRRNVRVGGGEAKSKNGGDNIEDFVGSRLLR